MTTPSTGALAFVAALCLIGATTASQAQTSAMTPLVPGYGKVAPVENPGVKPDPALDYKVVMSVTKAGEAGEPPPALEKAARLANLLAQSGVPAGHRHIVVVLHGPATAAVLTAAGMTARGKGANPSQALIAELEAAGVRVDVCGQALAAAKIARGEVLPDVQVDLSALTTLSTLQLKGYALIPD
jgi:intracellular sulfur oxidation DsrE/DsrF family protein